MKRLILNTSIFCFLAVFLNVGCQEHEKTKNIKRGTEVIVLGGDKFPKFLVGKWKADNKAWQESGKGSENVWEFVFEPDGTISSAVINTSSARIILDEPNNIILTKQGFSRFEPGLWTVQYDPKTRELFVSAVIERMHIEMVDSQAIGKTTDLFQGKVSEDGKTWMAEWLTCPDYWIYSKGIKKIKIGSDDDNTQCDFVGVTKFDKVE